MSLKKLISFFLLFILAHSLQFTTQHSTNMTSPSKIQLIAFWFIYSLHIQNIISPDIVILALDLIKDPIFISSYSPSAFKIKYNKFLLTHIFPFKRNTSHFTPNNIVPNV